jgi:hypothetical protein
MIDYKKQVRELQVERANMQYYVCAIKCHLQDLRLLCNAAMQNEPIDKTVAKLLYKENK